LYKIEGLVPSKYSSQNANDKTPQSGRLMESIPEEEDAGLDENASRKDALILT